MDFDRIWPYMRAAETIRRHPLIFVKKSVCGPGFLTIPVCIFVFHLGPRSEPRRPEWAWRKQWAKTSIRNTWPCLFFIVVTSFRPWAPRNVFIIKKHRVQHACFCFVLCFFVSFSYYVDYQRCLCIQMLKWFMAVYTFQPFPIFYIGIVYFYTFHCFEWFRIFSELCIDLFFTISRVFLEFRRICQLLIHVVSDFRWGALKSNFFIISVCSLML